MTYSDAAIRAGVRIPALTAAGTSSASGDATIVSAPGAGKRIVVTGFQLQNESSTATTMILKSGSGGGQRSLWRVLGQNQGDGCGYMNVNLICDENVPLVLNLSGANACGYSVTYYIAGM